jgi:hypothetical protein
VFAQFFQPPFIVKFQFSKGKLEGNAMELFLFEPAVYAVRYSCANITVDSIPLEQRQQPFNGWITIVLYCIFEVP